MNLHIKPGVALRGEAHLPGDKSISHRASLFAALAEGESRIDGFLVAGVTEVMLHALSSLGVRWELQETLLTLWGVGLRGFQPPAAPLDCGHSGTTIRFLAGGLAAAGVPAVLDGSAGLRRRPMRRIVEPLRQMGVPIEAASEGTAPLRLSARPADRPLKRLDFALPVASAQVKTALLLAALVADGVTTLFEPAPSRDHTERMLSGMGVELTFGVQDTGRSSVSLTPPLRPLRPLAMRVPGDFSSAAFIIAAAALTPGSDVQIRGVGLNPTRTGLLDALRAMGADIQIDERAPAAGEPTGDVRVRYRELGPVEVGGPLVVRMIDEFPAFGAVAAYAQGRTSVRDAAELRLKESDRIHSLCQGLAALGGSVEERPDGFDILGGAPLLGGTVSAGGDHRLGMSLAIAGLGAREPVVVHGAEFIAQSFPEFVPTLRSLGAVLEEEPEGEF